MMSFDHEKIAHVLSQNDILEKIPGTEKLKEIISLLQAAVPESPGQNNRLDGLFAPEEFWRGDASKGLSAPIGWLKDSDGLARFQLLTGAYKAVHGLMGGTSGSGKSNLLHVLIHSLCWQYAPDELNLYLLDFKDGTAFRHYTDTNQKNEIWLPHVKSISVSNDPEYALSLFEFLKNEQKRRNDVFKKVGNLDKYEDYREKGGTKMPRILVVIDEFQVMFDGSTEEQIAKNLTDILKQGRSAGIHLLLATQTLASMQVPSLPGMKGQLQLRISLHGNGDEQIVEDTVLSSSIVSQKECIVNENFGKRGYDAVVEIPRVSFSNNVTETGHTREAVFSGDDAEDQRAEFIFQKRVSSSGCEVQGAFDDGRELPQLTSSDWLSKTMREHGEEALDNASSSSGLLVGMDTAFIRRPVFAELENYFNGHLLVAWNKDGNMGGRVTGVRAEKGLLFTLLNAISVSEDAEAVYYDPAMDGNVFSGLRHVTAYGRTATDQELAERLQGLASSTCPNKFFIVENFNRARTLHPVETPSVPRASFLPARPGSLTAIADGTPGAGTSAPVSLRNLFLSAFKDQDQLPFHVVLVVKNFEAARKNVLARVREHNLLEGCSQRIAINLADNDLATFMPLGGLRSKRTQGKVIYADMNSGTAKFFMPFSVPGE